MLLISCHPSINLSSSCALHHNHLFLLSFLCYHFIHPFFSFSSPLTLFATPFASSSAFRINLLSYFLILLVLPSQMLLSLSAYIFSSFHPYRIKFYLQIVLTDAYYLASSSRCSQPLLTTPPIAAFTPIPSKSYLYNAVICSTINNLLRIILR